MGVAGARDVLGRRAELHGDRRFGNHVPGVDAEDVHAEHAVAFRVRQDFHEAVGGVVDLGAAVGGEREFADVIGDAGGLELLFALADRSEFGKRVDHVRYHVVVHVTRLPVEILRNRDALFLSLVSQHRTGDHVADREYVVHAGLEIMIHHDAAALVGRDAARLEAEPGRVGHAADRDQHHVRLDRLGRAARGRLDLGPCAIACSDHRGDFRCGPKRHPLLLQEALELPANFRVHAGQDAVEEFDHDHFRAESAPHRAQLEPDDARTDHEEPFRYLVEHQRAGGGDDALLVDVDAVEPRHVGAGGDYDRLGVERLALAIGRDLDLAGREDAANADVAVDLVLLEQEGDALDVAVDPFVLERHHGGKIEPRPAHVDAHAAEHLAVFLVALRRVQERFRRNAADVETGAPEGLFLLDHRDLHAELRRPNGAHVAAGTGADDDEVVGHDELTHKSSTSRAGSSSSSFTRTRKVTASRPSTMRWS